MTTTVSVLRLLGICISLVHLSEQKYEDASKCADDAGDFLPFRKDSKYLHNPPLCKDARCSMDGVIAHCETAGLVGGLEISNEVDWNSIKLFFNTDKTYFQSFLIPELDYSGLRRTSRLLLLSSKFSRSDPPYGPYSTGWSIKGRTTQKEQFVYWAAYEPDSVHDSDEIYTSLILLELPDGSITMGAQDHNGKQAYTWGAFCMFPPNSACYKESIEEKEAANSSLAATTIEVLNGGKALRLHTFFLSSQPLKYEVAKDICQKNGKTMITNEFLKNSFEFTKEDFKQIHNMLIEHLVKKGRAPGTAFYVNKLKSTENFGELMKVFAVKDASGMFYLDYGKDPPLYAMCYSNDLFKTRADCTEKLNTDWKRVGVTKYASMSGSHKMADLAAACGLTGMVAPVIDDYADWIHLQTFAIEKKQKLGIYNDYKWNEGAFVSTSGLTAYLLFWIDPAAGSMPIFQNNEKPAIQIDTKSYESKTYIFAKVVDPRTEPQTVAGLCMYPPGTICFSDQKAAAPIQISSKLQTRSVLNYEYGYWPEPKGYAESKELCSGITYDKYSRAPGPKKQWATPKEAESFYHIFWKFNFQHDVLPFPVTLDADDKGIHMISDDKWTVTHTYREYVKGEPHVQAVRVCEVYAPWGHCCE